MRLFDAAKSVPITEIYKKYVGEIKSPKQSRNAIAVHCPFHEDHRPSLNLYKNNTFYCFGCHAGEGGGTTVDFVMKLKNLDNVSAAKLICEDFGIEYEESFPNGGGHVSERKKAADEEAAYLLAVNGKLAEVFHLCLAKAPNPKYFEDRGVGSLAESHRLGYCPNGPLFKKESIEDLQGKGLCDENGVCVFHDRYIIPITSYSEKVIGFIARATPELEAQGAPKYLISQNSALFHKRSVFFNPNGLREKSREVIVVEGAFDALALIAAGVQNVVSPLTNSLSDQQLEAIRKTGKAVVCAFDWDEAGEEARRKLIRYAKGIEVSVPVGPTYGCKDPSELLERYEAEGVRGALSKTVAAPLYEIWALSGKPEFATPEGQDEAWKDLCGAIGSPEPAYAEKYPLNVGYTSIAIKRFWARFDELTELAGKRSLAAKMKFRACRDELLGV